jgi:hypothetical protein
MEPEALLPHSQDPANCPYPEPDQSSASPSFYFLKILCVSIFPSTRRSSKFSLSLTCSHQNSVCISPVSHACFMLCLTHCSRGYFPNNVWCTDYKAPHDTVFSSTVLRRPSYVQVASSASCSRKP